MKLEENTIASEEGNSTNVIRNVKSTSLNSREKIVGRDQVLLNKRGRRNKLAVEL